MATIVKNKAKASAKSESKERKAGPNTGRISKLSISGTWCLYFQENERASKANKMTDEQIQKQMRKEFPDRDSKDFTDPRKVQAVRSCYNQGRFTEGKPKTQSHRYDENGEVITGRVRREGTGRKPKAGSAKEGRKGKSTRSGKRAKKAK